MSDDEKKRLNVTPGELRGRREALGMSINELARRLDVSATTVMRWEAEEMPIRSPAMLAHALNDIERARRKPKKKAASK